MCFLKETIARWPSATEEVREQQWREKSEIVLKGQSMLSHNGLWHDQTIVFPYSRESKQKNAKNQNRTKTAKVIKSSYYGLSHSVSDLKWYWDSSLNMQVSKFHPTSESTTYTIFIKSAFTQPNKSKYWHPSLIQTHPARNHKHQPFAMDICLASNKYKVYNQVYNVFRNITNANLKPIVGVTRQKQHQHCSPIPKDNTNAYAAPKPGELLIQKLRR